MDATAPRPQRRPHAEVATRGLVPPARTPVPARTAPIGATGVRVGQLVRHRRSIAPVVVGKPMPAGPRDAVHAEPVEPAGAVLPLFLRAVSRTARSS